MRIYISGPISGNPDFAEQFAKAAETIKARGYEYINPAELGKVLPDAAWRDYIDICRQLVPKADAITFLKGWKGSNGARIESEEARIWGLQLYRLDTNTFEDPEP